MFGKSKKYEALEVLPFEFPELVDVKDLELKNERHFIEFILRNDWVQRKLGIKAISSNGLFPDLKAEIYDNSGCAIKVEVEYWAENYKSHGHLFKGCDLILSFFRSSSTRFVKGVPVWSFYKGHREDDVFDFTLLDDMNYDFNEHPEGEDNKPKFYSPYKSNKTDIY